MWNILKVNNIHHPPYSHIMGISFISTWFGDTFLFLKIIYDLKFRTLSKFLFHYCQYPLNSNKGSLNLNSSWKMEHYVPSSKKNLSLMTLYSNFCNNVLYSLVHYYLAEQYTVDANYSRGKCRHLIINNNHNEVYLYSAYQFKHNPTHIIKIQNYIVSYMGAIIHNYKMPVKIYRKYYRKECIYSFVLVENIDSFYKLRGL